MISIGIDIGQHSVKVAEVESTAKGFTLLRTQEFPLSPDPSKDIRLEVVEILRNLAQRYDPSNTRFVVAIPQERVSLRERRFPFRERHKIQKSLPFELEDDIPFSQDDAIFDAKVVRYVGQFADVLALACPKEYIQQAIMLGLDGQIEPDIVSVEGLALSNLFENWAAAPREEQFIEQPIPEPASAEVVLHMGHQSTVVLFLKEGYLLDVRHVDWGGKDLAEAVAQKLNLHYLEALKELKRRGQIVLGTDASQKDLKALSGAICDGAEKLVQELKLLLLDVQGTHNVHFNHIALTGGVAQLKNLGGYLTQKLEVATNRLRSLNYYPGLDFSSNPHSETVCGLAIGLALEGIKRPKNPAINLLKEEFARQSQTFKMLWEKWSYTVRIAAAGFVILMVYSFVRDTWSLEAMEASQNVLQDKAKLIANMGRATPASVSRFVQKQKAAEQSRKKAEALIKEKTALEILKQISDITPGQRVVRLNVLRLAVTDKGVLVEGEVADPKTLPAFETALKSMAKGGNLQRFESKFPTTPGWTNFGFRFHVERNRGA